MTISERQPGIDAIVGVDYLFAREVDTETKIGLTKVTLTPVSGKAWKPIYITPGSAALTSEQKDEFEGKIIENKFEMKVPGASADLLEDLMLICGRAIVLKLTYESGAALICGGKEKFLKLVYSGTHGTNLGYVLQFDYKSRDAFKWEQL